MAAASAVAHTPELLSPIPEESSTLSDASLSPFVHEDHEMQVLLNKAHLVNDFYASLELVEEADVIAK